MFHSFIRSSMFCFVAQGVVRLLGKGELKDAYPDFRMLVMTWLLRWYDENFLIAACPVWRRGGPEGKSSKKCKFNNSPTYDIHHS